MSPPSKTREAAAVAGLLPPRPPPKSTIQIALSDPIDCTNPAINLSEQVMLTCSGAGSCNGGYVTSASSYLANTGLLRKPPPAATPTITAAPPAPTRPLTPPAIRPATALTGGAGSRPPSTP